VLAFLLIIPRDLESFNLATPPAPDELNYYSHATAIAYGRLNYAREPAHYMPFNHAVGPSLLAVPVVFLGSLVDRFTHNEVVERRTAENLTRSYTGLGFPVATQIYIVLGTFLLYRLLDRGTNARYAAITTGISVMSSGVLFFAYRRAVSSHVYEFAAISLALYLLWCPPQGRWNEGRRKWGLTAAVAAIVFLVRYNDLPISIAFIWATLASHFSPGTLTGWLRQAPARRVAAWQFLSLFLLVGALATIACTAHVYGGNLWNASILQGRLFRSGVGTYFERLVHVFFGRDWALVATAPLVLWGLGSCAWLGLRRYLAVPFLIALACNLAVTVAWGTQGSAYGYRYFVPSALPLATIGLSRWIERGPVPSGRLILAITVAVIPTVLLVIFGVTLELALVRGETRWDTGWVNNDYVVNAFEAVFARPLLTYGALVPVSGIGVVKGWLGAAPEWMEPISVSGMIKIVTLWVLPLGVGGTLAMIFDRKSHG